MEDLGFLYVYLHLYNKCLRNSSVTFYCLHGKVRPLQTGIQKAYNRTYAQARVHTHTDIHTRFQNREVACYPWGWAIPFPSWNVLLSPSISVP